MNPPISTLLTPYRVLDLTGGYGYFCSKILGDLGARIIRLEKPGQTRDYWWLAYNSDKILEYGDVERDREKVIRIAGEVDFVVESFPPGYLDSLGLGYAVLKKNNPKLIYTSLTPFGQSGPYKDYKASDLELMAMSGVMYLIGDADRPPVRIGFPQSYLVACAHAAFAMLIALHWRASTGRGQRIDVSAQESLFDVLMNAPYVYAWQGSDLARNGKHRFGVSGGMYLHPLIWKCKDGHVAYMMQGGKLGAYSNSVLARYIDEDGVLPDYLTRFNWDALELHNKTPEYMAAIWEPFAGFFRRHTMQEIYRIVLQERLQLFPLNTLKESLADEQLNARDFWQARGVPDLNKTVKFPGPFARVSLTPGSHRSEQEKKKDLPFTGLKIADFSWVATGPWITAWLAAYGAEVIKIESTMRLDANRIAGPNKDNIPGPDRSAYFLVFNPGKRSATLNLGHPEGRKLAKQLVKWADVVVESFAPGQMKKWGLSYDELKEINPGLIMLSASMMGATGPHAEQPGLGMLMTALVGFTGLTGWPDRDPSFIWGAYADVLTSRLGAATFLAALDFCRKTNHGCYIDISQYEASMHYLSPLLLEYQDRGQLRGRMGNRSLFAAPHGVFPCQGEDRWCALSVYTNREWESFCKVIGKPEWISDARFATFDDRKKNEDELEQRIADWTSQFTAHAIMAQMQAAGINAGVVQKCSDLFKDPQLNYRRHFIPVNHHEVGVYDYFSPGFRLEEVSSIAQPAPCLGADNEYVYKQILGLSDEEYNRLAASGALT